MEILIFCKLITSTLNVYFYILHLNKTEKHRKQEEIIKNINQLAERGL